MFESTSVLEKFDGLAYIGALISIAKADGIKSVERNFIEDQARVLGVDPDALWEHPPINLDQFAQTASTVTKRLLIRDCITLASVDDDYSDNERHHILSMAVQFNIQTEMVEKLESWVQRYKSLVREIEDLLEG